MKAAIDISPISELGSGHHVRGVGFYLQRLRDGLEKYCKSTSFSFFTKVENIPYDADIVHFPYFEPFFPSLPNLNKKTIVTVHDLTPIVFPKQFPVGIKGSIRWQIQKRRLKGVDAIITDSEASKKDIVRLTHVSPEKIHVVYLAAGEEFSRLSLSAKEKEAVRAKYNLPDKFGLYVGDVTWNKNLPRLVQAIKKTDIPFVFVGKMLTETNYDRSNPWNSDLVKVQEMLAQNKNVNLLGFVPTEDLVKIYNLATFLILPSLYEGFGLPVLEAMQCGTPVITTGQGSLTEVAGAGAYLVNPEDIDDIARGMKDVFTNESLRKSLQQKGFDRAKMFSWEKAARETNDVYMKVANLS